MIIVLKPNITEAYGLSENRTYEVIGIEAGEFRILNDNNEPYLYEADFFEQIDYSRPQDWVTEYSDSGLEYSYPEQLNSVGFFEDYFDGDFNAIFTFHNFLVNRGAEEFKASSIVNYAGYICAFPFDLELENEPTGYQGFRIPNIFSNKDRVHNFKGERQLGSIQSMKCNWNAV